MILITSLKIRTGRDLNLFTILVLIRVIINPNLSIDVVCSASSTPNLFLLPHKENHIIFEDNFKRFHDVFLNKSYTHKYFLSKEDEPTLKINFLQPFENHNLLKNLGMNKNIIQTM